MHNLCSPCAVHYDYVLKLESMKDDNNLFVDALATHEKPVSYLRSLLTVRNKNRHQKKSHDVAPDIAVELQNLTDAEKEQVIETYRLDMDLFGYDIETESARMNVDDLTTCEES